MKRFLPLLTILLAVGFASPPVQELQRLPLQKKKIELKSPSSWSKRFVKVDPQTKEEIHYDPKPRIEMINAKAGKYNLKWIGYDGKEKVVLYQRPDCIDAVVAASTSRSSSGVYEYEYAAQNLAISGDYLNGFAVQNFSSDISPKRPSRVENVLVGDMTSNPFDSSGGNWIRFAPLPPHPKVQPGQKVRFKLYSSSPPGLVLCRVNGGDFVMKGVGEDMPEELEALLLGYGAWPSGYTIGPVDKLKGISQAEQISYLLKTLPQCRQQGWLTVQTLRAYEQELKRQNLQVIFTRAANDLKSGSITTEVFAIIEGMKK